MAHSKIGYQKWAIAIFLIQTRHIQHEVTSRSGHQTAWFMMQRIREAMSTMAADDNMAGPVEVDEMYAEGKEKNKHANKKGKHKKVAIAGIRDRKTGRVVATLVPETTSARL